MSNYVNVAIFRDTPSNENSFNSMMDEIPVMLVKMFESNDYVLTYLDSRQMLKPFNVVEVPYGRSTRIGVVLDETVPDSSINPNITYKEVNRVIRDSIYD